MKKYAFTLAEVLITLGIIGIVASITIPNFIKKYYATAYSQHFDIFTKNLTEASKRMAINYKLGPYADTNEFVGEFKNYLKLERICDSSHLSNCFAKVIKYGDEDIDVNDLSSSSNFGKDDYKTANVGLHFVDGLTGIISWNPDCSIVDPYNLKDTDPSSCISYILDLNGYKTPNVVGRDIVLVGVEIQINKIETIRIPCSKFSGYENCSTVEVEVADSTASSIPEGDSKYTASDNGVKMSYYMAKKTCEDKGLRLPNASELHAMYIASTKGVIAPFIKSDYWASGGWGASGPFHNCYMGGGNCGDGSMYKQNYVRCVK